ncbi:MAG: MMPL family transporter [Bacteroidota bacterium]
MRRLRQSIFIVFTILTAGSVFYALQLQFSFSFEEFFPQGDPDLEFYQEFIEAFETDINFLLVAVENEGGVFEQSFLERFNDFSIKTRDLPYILESNSLTQIAYPLKTPFGITTVPTIHIDQPERYDRDRERILADQRFLNTFIDEEANSLVVAMKTDTSVLVEESEKLIAALTPLVEGYNFDRYHILGPAYFQKEMVEMQKREVAVSAIVSGILVSLVMFWIFRKPWGIAIALFSIALGLLLFLGGLGITGRPLNAMSALYPVIMIIVGTSDVIHIMTKYIDELRKGKTKKDAVWITVKEIGLATFLTSVTTAIGFATLLTSRLVPIQQFGVNAAFGVLVAFGTVIFLTTAILSLFDREQLIKLGRGQAFWERSMRWAYHFTLRQPRLIGITSIGVLILCFVGLSQVTTNYKLKSSLPRGKKISEDFLFFEREYSGFRPFELAVFAQGDYRADDYEVLQEMVKVESYLDSLRGIGSINSLTTVYKSINQMMRNNRQSAYQFPEGKATFARYQKLVDQLPDDAGNILLSRDGKKARITSRVNDLGADNVKVIAQDLDRWIVENTDSTVVKFQRTGMGLIIDKNADYVRNSLLQGLGIAILIIGFLMAALFRDWRLVLISMIPNVFPLLLAGALIGFVGIELEAGVSIVFVIVFGIAVDDTIHFLSKFKLARDKGLSLEESLEITFMETGKAICLTTIILFFGFLVMLFSIHPPSVTIGLLISLTLLSAVLADLFVLPLLLRMALRDRA